MYTLCSHVPTSGCSNEGILPCSWPVPSCSGNCSSSQARHRIITETDVHTTASHVPKRIGDALSWIISALVGGVAYDLVKLGIVELIKLAIDQAK